MSEVVTWNDQDGRPEGTFSLYLSIRMCRLIGAGVVTYTQFVGKTPVRAQMYVPDLNGAIRSISSSFGEGWTQFEGVLDIPGLSPFRAADIIGGFGYGQGSVSINLFGHLFLIRGSIIGDLSGAETDQQSNTGGNQPIAILPGGAGTINQGIK